MGILLYKFCWAWMNMYPVWQESMFLQPLLASCWWPALHQLCLSDPLDTSLPLVIFLLPKDKFTWRVVAMALRAKWMVVMMMMMMTMMMDSFKNSWEDEWTEWCEWKGILIIMFCSDSASDRRTVASYTSSCLWNSWQSCTRTVSSTLICPCVLCEVCWQ